MSHIQRDEYLLTLTGEITWEQHLRRSQQHLLELCPACAKEWDGKPQHLEVEDPAPETSEPDGPTPPPEPLPADLERLEFSIEHHAAEKRLLSRMREARRLALDDLRVLKRHPRSDWPGVVSRSRSRFRSRALAELLLEEAEARVGRDPAAAAALAGLVPAVLSNGSDHSALPWAQELAAQAAAQRKRAQRESDGRTDQA